MELIFRCFAIISFLGLLGILVMSSYEDAKGNYILPEKENMSFRSRVWGGSKLGLHF
ncbi:hypothetical protein KFU94_01530 [Chloroflexi bacterium TSY]|nr:hypothetical protein [Chloroflexi bacterium TSY]